MGTATIDFLKVDVEGGESDVLASIDLRRFRPLVIVVEAIEPLTHRLSHAGWEPRVLESGYVHAAFDGINRFYVAEERAELCESLGYPLTPLDNYLGGGGPPAVARVGDGDGRPLFPSLAEDLTREATPTARDGEPLTVVLDGVADPRLVSSVVEPGSSLLALDRESLGSALAGRFAPTLEGLRDAIAAQPHDVLVVSDTTLLTRSLIGELRATLASDTACATVSAADRPSARARGVPAPAVEAPVRGVVLVRRDHLLLALDEARLLAQPDVALVQLPEAGDLVDEVLATLVRPGFVHRLCGRDELLEPASAAASPARRRGRVADVVVDARCLRHRMSGTQVHVLGLLGGLARIGTNVTVLVPRDVDPSVEPSLADLRAAMPFVERLGPGRPAVFHRPSQIGAMKVLADCLSKGDRLVLTQLDMIVDRTGGYKTSPTAWESYRRTTSRPSRRPTSSASCRATRHSTPQATACSSSTAQP